MAKKQFTPQQPKTRTPIPTERTRVEAAEVVRPKIEHGPIKRLLIPAAILLIISFLLYAKSLSFGYVLDDLMVIEKNAYTQKGFGGLSKIFSEDSFTGYFGTQAKLLEGGRYRPLSLATFAAEIGMFGPNKPFWGHFFNIICYWLTALLLYMVLERLVPTREGQKWYMSVGMWASVLFLLHPLHSEAVANIKGRDERSGRPCVTPTATVKKRSGSALLCCF
jgi:protein O-mannosyl-transferase